jgi:acetylglutamate synthase
VIFDKVDILKDAQGGEIKGSIMFNLGRRFPKSLGFN